MDDALKQVICYVAAEDQAAFHRVVNEIGVRGTPYVAGEIFRLGLKQKIEELDTRFDELPADLQLEVLAFKARGKQAQQYALNVLAARGLSDEEADTLGRIAEELDLDEEEAAQYASGSLFAKAILGANPNTKTAQCIQWLGDLFREHERLPCRTVLDLGEKAGFSSEMVRRAKRRLGIKSDNVGTGWDWLREESDRGEAS